MIKNDNKTNFLPYLIVISSIVIFLTRIPTLYYNTFLHPDEHVFYLGANSLLNSILYPSMEFTEFMEYPEGSYYFHMIFQFFGRIWAKLLHTDPDVQLWGRIASVFYFSVAAFLGGRILAYRLGKSPVAVAIYSLIMCFSLFFIEQSRYGTGDIISFMLLMLLLTTTDQAICSRKSFLWWMISFFICGILAAVKYPLLVFILIPLCSYIRCAESKQRMVPYLLAFLFICLLGLFVFSPKASEDPAYFLRVIQREGNAYVTSGTLHEAGGFTNHLAALLTYGILYSDVPFLLPITVFGCIHYYKHAGLCFKDTRGSDFLFYIAVPCIIGLFFFYNLFVKLLFFRTFTPFFGIAILYGAIVAERLVLNGSKQRYVIVALLLFTVFRGVCLIYDLSFPEKINNSVSEQIANAVDKNWREKYVTSMFSLHDSSLSNEQIVEFSSYGLEELIQNNNGMEIQPGQLVITGCREYHMGQEYIFDVDEVTSILIDQWAAFKEINSPYYVGQAYPDSLYYFYGAWIRGGTLSQYEFPCNYIYYRSAS